MPSVIRGVDGFDTSDLPISATTANVLAATAGASAGAVGTYAFAATSNNTSSVAPGSTIAGSSLLYAGVRYNGSTGDTDVTTTTGALSGTWQAMGFKPVRTANIAASREATMFLRIS
jgi:hypothetical protein